MLPANFNSGITERLLDWLWRSWNALGVAGQGSMARNDRVIDPESLVLASTVWARYDARLFDEILDWLCLYGSLINLQRLRNLQRAGLGDSSVLSAMAAVMHHSSGQSKWKALIPKASPPAELKPLFLSLEGNDATWGVPEPWFAAQGFHRGRFELRQMSQPPSPHHSANLWLKLRSLFGTNTRAEVMLQLLTTGPSTAGEIAYRSSFTARALLVTLREMAFSGHLHEPPRRLRTRPRRGESSPPRHRGPSAAYSLRTEEWAFLRTWSDPAGFPALQLPAPLLTICQLLLSHNGTAKQGLSTAAQHMQIRHLLASPLEQIQQAGLESDLAPVARLPGDAFVAALVERLPKAIASL